MIEAFSRLYQKSHESITCVTNASETIRIGAHEGVGVGSRLRYSIIPGGHGLLACRVCNSSPPR